MEARAVSWWLDEVTPAGSPLTAAAAADVVIIGAGFTGLWTALHLTDRDPGLRIVILEAEQVGHGASGRNGGFVDPSLTHGLHNGLAHFPGENDELLRIGRENYLGLVDFVRDHGIEAHLEETGTLDVATAPWQLEELAEAVDAYRDTGETVELLTAEETRAEVDSPTYLGGLHRPDGGALVHPGALAAGLADVARRRGVVIHERTPAIGLERRDGGVRVRTPGAPLDGAQAVLATNAYSHRLLARTGRHYVPVHDYVLLTAPLTAEQLARIGWKRRQGVADSGNQFHYYRLTHDDRILWGGYDAIYRFGNGVGPRDDHRRATYDLLARHFRATFPQLGDVRFERWWGGPIATTTRFSVAFGQALGGRVRYALGYTGLGVAATRFAGRVLADQITDPASPLLELELVRRPPFPFPPEPLRWVGVQATRRALAKADRHDGRRGAWLRLLDRFGIGFDS